MFLQNGKPSSEIYSFLCFQEQPCNVHPDQRKDCGWIGISRDTCESRGCCYDDTIPNAKWCFYKLGTKGMKNLPHFR